MALYKRPGSKFYWMKFVFDGRLIQQSTKCKNRRDAETVESAYRTQLALGKVGIKPKRKPITFKQAAEEYIAAVETDHAGKPGTVKRMRFAAETLVRFFGSMRVDRIEKADVERFKKERSNQRSIKTGSTIKNDTVNLELVTLKTIFKRMISEGYISESPARDISQLKESERRFYVLSYEDERRYLFACPQPLQDVATLILETGMRPKEIYELNRERVDLAKRRLQVVEAKTASGNRWVWLSDRAAAVLRGRVERFKGDYLFPAGDRDGQGPSSELSRPHRAACEAIGLSFRLYDCRHTFATRALESGVDLLTLAAMLGHSNLDELRRYAHPSESRKSEAVQEMEKKRQKAL